MGSRRTSSEASRRLKKAASDGSPRRMQPSTNAKYPPAPAPSNVAPAPSVLLLPPEPLAVDDRLRNQIKAANLAVVATNFVMAVCFILVPLSCYRNLVLNSDEYDTGASHHAGEPWEQYFNL